MRESLPNSGLEALWSPYRGWPTDEPFFLVAAAEMQAHKILWRTNIIGSLCPSLTYSLEDISDLEPRSRVNT
jgi:hypothetical protein